MHTSHLLLLLTLAAACDRTGNDQNSLKPPPPDPAAGPSKEEVAAAWRTYSAYGECLKDMRFNDPEVLGTSTEGNRAVVLVVASGDWYNRSNPGEMYFSGPCVGFTPAGGKGQHVQRKLRFTKYDTGWRFDGPAD